MKTFPDISQHLQEDSACQIAYNNNPKNNHLAKVLLECYQLIPYNETNIQQNYINLIGHKFLDTRVVKESPAFIGSNYWFDAEIRINYVLQNHLDTDWAKRIINEFRNKNNICK